MTYTHAIIYIGAPHGINEAGEIVSRHRSKATAERAYQRLCYPGGQRTAAALNHVIRPLGVDGSWHRGEGEDIAP